ncbi:MAG TPA: serine O-acetyltransferase [Elusimicrobiota bacterium]|nr:serine O-acetyltransferase [Elusimicrobiota bacterium]
MLTDILQDVKAIFRNDPAARNFLETLICHTPLHAILIYRLAHFLYGWRIPVVPRLLATLAKVWSGVEIHPAAAIGAGFFIDHGVGVVIGETAEIGVNCVMFHNVTLGGTGKHSGKRHPSVKDNVLIGTNSVLLGPLTVGENSRVGANSFIIMHDVPPNCTVGGTPAHILKRDGRRVDEPLPRTQFPAD